MTAKATTKRENIRPIRNVLRKTILWLVMSRCLGKMVSERASVRKLRMTRNREKKKTKRLKGFSGLVQKTVRVRAKEAAKKMAIKV